LSGNISWKKAVLAGGFLLCAVVFALYRFQEKMLYQPRPLGRCITPADNPEGYRHPGELGLFYEELLLVTRDGLRLQAWFIRPNDPVEVLQRTTLIFFHENAGNMGFRLPNFKLLYDSLGLNIFVVSYRGYGASEGEPSEEGMLIDAETAWKFITNRPDVNPHRIIVFGRSLGGAVAVALAANHATEILALIIENTFSSISDLVDHIFPLLTILKDYILRLEWSTKTRIPLATCPILFLSGLQDEVVPPSMMRQLYSVARSSTKKIVTFPGGSHNETWLQCQDSYILAISTFLKSLPYTETAKI